MKTQTIRLLDVFLIGPYLIWLARRERGIHHPLLVGLGLATMIYNGVNWVAENEKTRTR
jgi:hypothetical protein